MGADFLVLDGWELVPTGRVLAHTYTQSYGSFSTSNTSVSEERRLEVYLTAYRILGDGGDASGALK